MSTRTREAPPPAEPPPVVEEVVDRIPMLDPMGDAPRDGRWIEVRERGDSGEWRRARFYQTRMRTAGSVAWVPVSCWSVSEPSRYMHRVHDPVAWRWPVEATLAV